MNQRAQTNLTVVDEGFAARGKRLVGHLIARAITGPTRETAFAAALAIDAGFDAEKRVGVERVGGLAAAADVTHRGSHAEHDGEHHQNGVAPARARLVHGRTS